MSESERDHIRGCHLSRRRLEEDDILRVSRRFGAGWRDVGNSLHFTHAQLDQVHIAHIQISFPKEKEGHTESDPEVVLTSATCT